MDGIQALHDLLVKGGYYTKSVDDFRAQVKDPAYREKVQSVLKRDGAWSDGIADVLSSGGISMAPPPLKKKEQTMDLSSEDGSLESQESIVMQRPPEQEKFDIYSKIGQPPPEEKEELPKSFQNLDYSKGISSVEGIQSLFGQVKDKLKSAPVEDIVSFGNIAAKKSKEGKGSLTPFNQSSVGKVSGWINDIENGVEISPEDEKRWKEISPNSYNQTLNKSTVNKQIAPNEVSFEFAKSVNDVARINKKNIQDNDAKSGFDDIMESAKQLQSIGIDVANIGNVSTRNEMNKVQAMYDSRLKELQEKYPEVETEAMIEGGTVRVKGRGLKYSEDLRKLQDAKSYLLSNIGKIHAGKYALANPNLSSEQIGAEVLKIADPTTYKNYIQGGSESLDVKADIDRLGIQVLKSTNNPNLIKKAFEAEDVHDKKYPDEIIAETKRRIAVERAKDKGLSYIANLESITTSEADKYADQLQGKYKKAYMEIIRPQAIKETEAFLGKDSYAASKGNGIINLPPMGGAVNSLLGGVMQPVKGTYDFFADRVMPEKYVINKALAKNRNEFVNEDEVKRQIDGLLSKKDFTISDAKELERLNGELKTQLPYKALIDGTFELTGQVIGQAALTELGVGVVSSGARGLAIGSKLVGLRNTAAAVTNISRNAKLVRDISGMTVGGLSSYSDAQKEAINLGLDGWKQNLYSATVAGLNVVTERFFPDEKIFQAFMKDMSPLVGKMVRDMSSGSITESVLSSELKRAILSVAPKYLGNFALENQKEAFEEAATQFGTSIAKGLLAPDKTNLENEINAVKQTYLETTIYGTLTGGIAAIKETKSNSVNTRSLFTLGQSSKDVQQFIGIVNQRLAKGDITQEEADKKIKAATNIKDIVQTSIPAINQKKPLTDAEKIKLSSVLLAERTLKDDIENPQLEDVKSINQKQLKEVTDLKEKILNNEVVVDNDLNAYTPEEYKQKVKEDAVQEQTAGQVPVQPTAGVGQEMEGGVSEPKTVLTPEQKSEKEDQKSKLEEAIAAAPDGATEITMGEEVIPITDAKSQLASIEQELAEPTTAAAPTQEQTQSDLLELDANEKEDVTFIDKDGNEQSVDGNEDMLAELYHEALDVPENERTMAQQSAIDAVVSLETLPEVAPVEMHNEEQATAFEKKATEPMHKLVSSQARNVLSALKSILPNLQLNIHEDENSYNSTMSKVKGKAGSRGNFHVDRNGNIRIDINLNKANARTIAHEAAHAVLYKMFGDNQRAFKAFHKQLANVISSMGKQDFIGDNKQITNVKSYLNKFVSRYQDKEARPEEYMAELSGILGDNAANLSVSGWRKIALMVRDFIDRVTDGKVKLFDNVNDTKDVVDFFNSMAQSFKTGEAVKAAPESITKKFGREGSQSTSKPSLNNEIDVNAIRLKNRPGKKVSKGLSVYTRNGKKIIEESEDLSLEYVKENAPEVFISNSNILASFPLVAGVKKFEEIKTIEQAQEVYDIFTNEVSENLKFLMNSYPEKYRDISTLWYDGANIIAQNEAKENNISVEQAAGIIASLSPQKDWYQNVRLAQLVSMAFNENPPMTDKMIEKQKKIIQEGLKPKATSLKKAKERYSKSRSNKNLKALNKQEKAYLKYTDSADKIIKALTSYLGKNINDVPDYIKPYMVRLHHEINTTKDYRVLRPDGVPMDFAVKKDGTRAKSAWGSYGEIGKAVSIYLNGSSENITRALGEMHKIRNFNNNIVDPMSDEHDVTMDTHAIAAALLMPLSGNSKQVGQNFGTGTSNSAPFGIKGLYYAYAEGYKKAAEDVGLLPRQIQSITWEAVRGLFTDVFKRDKNEVEKINKIWSDYENKKITIDETRNQIIKSAGGINPPTWSAEGGGLVQEGTGSDVKKGGDGRGGKLSKRGIVGDKSGGTGRRGITSSKAEMSADDKKMVKAVSKSSLVGGNAKLAEDIVRNKTKAIKLEKLNVDPKTIRLLTDWEKGADGEWRYELDSSKSKMKVNVNDIEYDKEMKISDVMSYPKLFKAYPELRNLKVIFKDDEIGNASFNPNENIITLGYDKPRLELVKNAPKEVIEIAKKYAQLRNYEKSLESQGIEPFSGEYWEKVDSFQQKIGYDDKSLADFGYAKTNPVYGIVEPNTKFTSLVNIIDDKEDVNGDIIRATILHEIQHGIQQIEEFAYGGNETVAEGVMSAEEKKEYNKAVWNKAKVKVGMKRNKKSMSDLTAEETKIFHGPRSYLRSIYRRLAGEVEARNVEKRMNMTAEQRRNTPIIETEDRSRSKQIFVDVDGNPIVSKAQLVEEDYELSRDNQIDAEYDIQKGLGFRIGNNNYERKGDAIIRVKNHTPDWSNFNSDLENDPSIKKVINVTVGDYENSDSRRNKGSLEQAKKEYPNVEFIDVKVKDGESINEAIQRVSEIVNSKTATPVSKAQLSDEAEKKKLISDLKKKANKAISKVIESTFDTNIRNKRFLEIQTILADKIKEVQDMKPVSKAQLSEEELPGYDNMMSKVKGIVDKKLERQKKLTPDEENFDKIKYKKERLQAALDYVMQSKVYEDANDVQRDQIVRDVRKSLGFKEKSAPGGASDLFIGIGRIIKMAKEKKMVTMTQTQFFYEQMNQLVRGGRDAKVAVRKVQKEISESMRALVNAGQLSSKQAAAIVRMYSKTNLLKPESVQRFIDYMAKVFANADYASKVSIAKNLKSKISELSKDKSKNPDLRAMATRFNQIDPTMVDDIDAYNELASKLVSGLTGSKIVGEDMKWAQGVSILGVRNYVDAAIKSQQEKKRQMLVNEMQVLLGIDASDMTYEDLKLFIEKEKEPESKEKEKIKRDNLAKKIEERLGIDTSGMTYKELKSLLIKSTISRAFNANSSVIKYMLYSGKDPFTEYPVTFTEQQKDILRRFIDMDLNLLTEKESIDAIDKLNLFLQNQGDFRSTAGMESILAKYDAEKNLRELINSNVLAPTIRKYFSPRAGRILLEQIVTVPMMFERLFKGVTMGGKVQEMSGVTKTINGKAIAERMARRIDTEYVLKFFKKKPNGESFNTAKNNIERGMAAFMMRNVIGTEQQMKDEFERRRGHIEKSIELLKKGDEVENKKADEYQEAYDKIVKDSKNIQDIKDSIDPINLDAIEWWSSKWDEHYPEMASVAANVYNKLLDKDINFNPDRYKRISTDTDKVNLTNDESVFDFNNGTIYKKEAGSLLESQRLTQLPANDKGVTNRYIDFSFDSNNSNAMYDALVDIKTAASIRQIDAFINSDNFYKLFKNRADGDVVKDRLKLMVNNMRDKSPFTKKDEAAKLIASINRLASVGVGQALGGVTQPLKQMGPIALNTLINSGGLHLGIMFDPARKKFIDESGYAIANRGIEAQTQIASLNKLINEAANSKGEKAMRLIEKANELQLKIFLVAPDVYIAKSSWFAYYEQALKKQGIKNVDYDTHKINKKAADYAQMMVDRQQNISDHDLAGKLYSESGNDYKNVFVKMLLAFSSFRMNTSSRLANDLSVFEYWNTSTKEDKIIALRSLSGYAVETVAFRLISLYVGVLTQQVVNYIRGTDDDEEDEKKQSNNLKGQLTTGAVEVLSPFPLVDKLVQLGVYTTLDLLQSGKEEDEKFNIYPVKADEEFFRSLGLFGILVAKGVQIGKLINLAATGEFVDDYTKQTKYLKESDKDLAGALIFPSLLGASGAIPSAELNSIVNKSIKDMKKDASTNNPDEVTADEREKMQELKQLQYLKDNYDLSQDEESFVNTEILERSLDIAPERDIKAEKELKKIKEVDKEWKKRLLGDYYSSEEQMKKFDPEKYEELFGKGSDWDEKHQAEKEVNKTWQKIKKKINWD